MAVVIKILKAIFVVALLVVIIAFIGLLPMLIIQYQVSNHKDWHNRNEVIASVKDNIDDLNILVNDLYKEYKNEMECITIENKYPLMYEDSVIFDNDRFNSLFENLKIKIIYCYPKDNKILFYLYTDYNVTTFIYYSLGDFSNYYYISKVDPDNFDIISTDIWTICFSKKDDTFGWYTEKIFENWYYGEVYIEGFKALKYIENDLKTMERYDIINKFKE